MDDFKVVPEKQEGDLGLENITKVILTEVSLRDLGAYVAFYDPSCKPTGTGMESLPGYPHFGWLNRSDIKYTYGTDGIHVDIDVMVKCENPEANGLVNLVYHALIPAQRRAEETKAPQVVKADIIKRAWVPFPRLKGPSAKTTAEAMYKCGGCGTENHIRVPVLAGGILDSCGSCGLEQLVKYNPRGAWTEFLQYA